MWEKTGHAGLALVSVFIAFAHAEAQSPGQSIERRLGPREEQLPKPQLLPEQEAPPLTPPQLPAPSPPPEAGGLRVFVSSIRVVGSTVFSEDEIRAVTAPFEGRVLSTTDLQNVADRITRLYVDHGYISSGAIIPDQDVVNGVVTIQVIEGSLYEIDIEGLQLLRKRCSGATGFQLLVFSGSDLAASARVALTLRRARGCFGQLARPTG